MDSLLLTSYHPPARKRGLKTISNERAMVITASCSKTMATTGAMMYQTLFLKNKAPVIPAPDDHHTPIAAGEGHQPQKNQRYLVIDGAGKTQGKTDDNVASSCWAASREK